MTLLFLNKVTQAFAEKVQALFADFSNWLMFVIGFETGWTFSPTIENPSSGATGLIQFLPSTAVWLGTSIEALKSMSAEQQLDFVKKYLSAMQAQYGRFSSYHDLYFAVFYPYAISQKDNYIMGSEKSNASVMAIALQNKGFDLNKDNQISKYEVKQWLDKKVKDNVPEEYWNEFFKKKTFCSDIKKKSSLAELSLQD